MKPFVYIFSTSLAICALAACSPKSDTAESASAESAAATLSAEDAAMAGSEAGAMTGNPSGAVAGGNMAPADQAGTTTDRAVGAPNTAPALNKVDAQHPTPSQNPHVEPGEQHAADRQGAQ